MSWRRRRKENKIVRLPNGGTRSRFRCLAHSVVVNMSTKYICVRCVHSTCVSLCAYVCEQNKTYRPCKPLSSEDMMRPMGEIRENGTPAKNYVANELKLFLEAVVPPVGSPADYIPPRVPSNTILLFFKYYRPSQRRLEYVGSLFVRMDSCVEDIRGDLIRMSGARPEAEILVFEEIKYDPVMCEVLQWTHTFTTAQLENGDIICFQEYVPEDAMGVEYPTVVNFMEYQKNKVDVRFRRLDEAQNGGGGGNANVKVEGDGDGSPGSDPRDIVVELGRTFTYDDVVTALAQRLGLSDPTLLRLSPHDAYTGQPRAAIKYRSFERLSDLLVTYVQATDIVYYEVCSMPLPELEQMRPVSVQYMSEEGSKTAHELQLPRDATVATALSRLATDLNISPKSMRVLDVSQSRIVRVLDPSEPMPEPRFGGDLSVGQTSALRCETCSADDMAVGSGVSTIGAKGKTYMGVRFYHVAPECERAVSVHGDPLLLACCEGMTLGAVKTCVRERLGVSEEELASWKFYHVRVNAASGTSEAVALEDDAEDVVRLFELRSGGGGGGDEEEFIGMEHMPKPSSARAPAGATNNRHGFERPVRIYT